MAGICSLDCSMINPDLYQVLFEGIRNPVMCFKKSWEVKRKPRSMQITVSAGIFINEIRITQGFYFEIADIFLSTCLWQATNAAPANNWIH